MKNFLSTLSALTVLHSFSIAQVPEDVLKYSWTTPGGTARNRAVGGALTSLGGDITAAFVNPAGLGFYKTNEFVFTPGFNFLGNKSNFRGTDTKANDNSFNLGTTGFVWGFSNYNSRWTNSAISLAITRSANFNDKISYTGNNNFSSIAERYAAEIKDARIDISNAPGSNAISFPARMAAYTYLVDTVTRLGGTSTEVISMSLYNNLKRGGGYLVTQNNTIESAGGITELNLGLASNMNDKVFIGGSIGVPLVNYKRTSLLIEKDATGNTNSNFDFTELRETYTSKGWGINARIGLILKPVEKVRFGLAVHTPSFYSLTDTYTGSMTTNTEEYKPYEGRTGLPAGVNPDFQPKTQTVDVKTVLDNGSDAAVFRHSLSSTWRMMASGTYILNEVQDITKQKGFIIADVEYVGYGGARFSPAEENGDVNYYNGVNDGVKNYYKGAFNFKAGGELKFTTIMARLGFAYYGNPYRERSELKGRRMFASGGLGYRNKGKFIDVTYVHALQKDINFPYRLDDKANTFASVNGSGGNIVVTVGFKW